MEGKRIVDRGKGWKGEGKTKREWLKEREKRKKDAKCEGKISD